MVNTTTEANFGVKVRAQKSKLKKKNLNPKTYLISDTPQVLAHNDKLNGELFLFKLNIK